MSNLFRTAVEFLSQLTFRGPLRVRATACVSSALLFVLLVFFFLRPAKFGSQIQTDSGSFRLLDWLALLDAPSTHCTSTGVAIAMGLVELVSLLYDTFQAVGSSGGRPGTMILWRASRRGCVPRCTKHTLAENLSAERTLAQEQLKGFVFIHQARVGKLELLYLFRRFFRLCDQLSMLNLKLLVVRLQLSERGHKLGVRVDGLRLDGCYLQGWSRGLGRRGLSVRCLGRRRPSRVRLKRFCVHIDRLLGLGGGDPVMQLLFGFHPHRAFAIKSFIL